MIPSTDYDAQPAKKIDQKSLPEGEKRKFKAIMVDTTDVMKDQARDAGDAAMTMELPENPENLTGVKKFFKGEYWSRSIKKIWKHGLWRDYFRNKEIAKAREKILEDENIFAAEGKDGAAHDKFVADIMEQFSSEYDETIHTDAGELRHKDGEIGTKEQETKNAIKKLIIEYAQGKIEKGVFTEEENRIFKELKADTDKRKIGKKEDLMHVSNLLQVAEEVKIAMKAGTFMEDEDFDIDLTYGKSKAGVRTEANFTRTERLAEKLSHTRLGSLVNETTMAGAFAIISTVGLKSAQRGANTVAKFVPLIGSALISAGFAKVREGKKVEEERRQHSREMARGEKFDPAKMERRKEMEESRYGTVSAQNLIDQLTKSRTAIVEMLEDGNIKTNFTPEMLSNAMVGLATIEARISLSDLRNKDLICYSDSTKVVEERRQLDIERAKMKKGLEMLFDTGLFTDPKEKGKFKESLDSKIKTQENILMGGENGIEERDRIFNKMKSKRSWKAARTALIGGALIGTATQEVAALFTNQTGLIEEALHHNVNVLHGGSAITETGTHNLTGLAYTRTKA